MKTLQLEGNGIRVQVNAEDVKTISTTTSYKEGF